MRTMIRWKVPAERGNETVKNGTMGKAIEAMLQELEPEAAYFLTEDGMRGGFMVFDMSEPVQLPRIAEPLFQALHAQVEFVPVMNADDLRKALQSIA